MKVSSKLKELLTRSSLLLMLSVLALPTTAESNFGVVLGDNLEDLCLSDQDFERGICVGYIEAILATQLEEISQAEIQCFATELLPLRNAGVRGWAEIQELLLWIDERLAEGDSPTESEEFAIEQTRKFVSDVEDRKELLPSIRGGSPPIAWRLCLLQHKNK